MDIFTYGMSVSSAGQKGNNNEQHASHSSEPAGRNEKKWWLGLPVQNCYTICIEEEGRDDFKEEDYYERRKENLRLKEKG